MAVYLPNPKYVPNLFGRNKKKDKLCSDNKNQGELNKNQNILW